MESYKAKDIWEMKDIKDVKKDSKDIIEIEYDNFIERQDMKTAAIENIHELYRSIIENYKEGNEIVNNPTIFYNLTIDKFRNWVINNNNELKILFAE